MTREQLIEKMAEAICYKMHDVIDAPVGTIFHSKELAETALDALLESLPAPASYGDGINADIIDMMADRVNADKYKQLIWMKK